ncbi:hypothetical protein Tco_0461671 [Tanacetum coccineum]
MGRSGNDVPGALLHNTIAPVMRERPLSVGLGGRWRCELCGLNESRTAEIKRIRDNGEGDMVMNLGSRGDGETPPATREEIEGQVSAHWSLIKEHNAQNFIAPIRLDFDNDNETSGGNTHDHNIVVGTKVDDAKLKNPFKEGLKSPLLRE